MPNTLAIKIILAQLSRAICNQRTGILLEENLLNLEAKSLLFNELVIFVKTWHEYVPLLCFKVVSYFSRDSRYRWPTLNIIIQSVLWINTLVKSSYFMGFPIPGFDCSVNSQLHAWFILKYPLKLCSVDTAEIKWKNFAQSSNEYCTMNLSTLNARGKLMKKGCQ